MLVPISIRKEEGKKERERSILIKNFFNEKYIYLVIQMMKIYFSYTTSLWPQFLAQSFQNPWNFLGHESSKNIVCYNIWSLNFSLRAIKVK